MDNLDLKTLSLLRKMLMLNIQKESFRVARGSRLFKGKNNSDSGKQYQKFGEATKKLFIFV